jgi:Family of unknown function (DUF6510)
MDPLDGNAIAGRPFDYVGSDMTSASVRCLHCGTPSVVAELRVYSRAPGAVARCPACDNVVMVLVDVRGSTQAYGDAFELLERT